MSLGEVEASRRRPPTILASNNPFRRAISPASNISTSPTSPPSSSGQPARMSTNPFLDPHEITNPPPPPPQQAKSGASTAFSEDIFRDLSLLDKPAPNGAPLPPNGGPSRAGTFPAPGPKPMGPDERRDRPPRPPGAPPSPSRREHPPRPRGMSESSVMEDRERRHRLERERGERGERLERTESEERRRRERRREREERHRREKEKIRKGERPMKRPQGLDIIDKLDVTGIYGQGLFHHDGPFDACNPHRNSKKDRRAPMQAFPADSANMAIGGAGPLRSRLDLDKFHGRGEEGFQDYAVTRKAPTTFFNPTDRTEPVHGEETGGLGTSTFLEGAPASRSALQRRESEEQNAAAETAMNGGLSRKRSLAQRLRGMSNSRRGGAAGFRSPEARYQDADALESSPPNAVPGQKALSAGGPLRAKYTRDTEVNPFDTAYDEAFDKKGAQIKIAEQEANTLAAPSSPRNGLVRSVTTDSTGVRKPSDEEDRPITGGGGGFLSRMKSLKKGRARPERKDA